MARKSTLKRFGYTALAAIIVARFSRWLNSPSILTEPDGSPRNRAWIGQYGENVATAWLRSQQCHILARNFKGPHRGEVDIIARSGKLLLFIEVKTRQKETKIRPLFAVDAAKQRLIERGANAWLKKLGSRNLPWRFDVIEVYVKHEELPEINHVKDAF